MKIVELTLETAIKLIPPYNQLGREKYKSSMMSCYLPEVNIITYDIKGLYVTTTNRPTIDLRLQSNTIKG